MRADEAVQDELPVLELEAPDWVAASPSDCAIADLSRPARPVGSDRLFDHGGETR
jgi:hypothetical protein